MEDNPQLIAILGHSGRMLAGSKSGYHRDHPDHFAIFNAGICVERGGLPELVWEGDLDLTLDEPKLVAAAKALGETLFVVYERDRPDAFHGARGEVLGRAELVIDADGEARFNERRVRRDSEGRLRLDLDKIQIDALQSEVAMWRGRCERLDKLVLRGIEQGWLTDKEREEVLWFPGARSVSGQIAVLHNEGHPVADQLREIADDLDLVFVRRQDAGGCWGIASLAALPVEECLAQLAAWISEGRIPVRPRRVVPEASDD